MDTFVRDSESDLHNPDHDHLRNARIGVLWARPSWERRGREVLALAETAQPASSITGWKRARLMMQLDEWFGTRDLDFVLTFWAAGWMELDDRAACALMEHELYHCAEDLGEFGEPKFTRDGRPRYRLRGHDVEEFTAVARRYGAWSQDLADLRDALAAEPLVGGASIKAACGTCRAAA